MVGWRDSPNRKPWWRKWTWSWPAFFPTNGTGTWTCCMCCPYIRVVECRLPFTAREGACCSEGLSDLFTEASKVARPFFERHGFHVTEEQDIEIGGVVFQRYGM